MPSTCLRIQLVVGTRPNYVKANPVYEALAKTGHFKLTLINTGQHYDTNMTTLFFHDLKMKAPDINLEVGSGTHAIQTAKIMERYEPLLIKTRPHLVLVFGDVNSTIASSLVAVKLGIPVAHVEAGLRSFDWSMPEEINRVLTDRIARLLFTTCVEAETNLTNEGIKSDRIHFVGNTMIDSLVALKERFASSTIHEKLGIDANYALLTFHRPANVDQESNLKQLISTLEKVAEQLPCLFPVHPRTQKKLAQFGLEKSIKSNPRFILIPPLGYIDFMRLQRDAAVVLTDSGGIQEETTYFRVPCLTVRENTERPVTITQGTNTLVGTDYARLPSAVHKVLTAPKKSTTIPKLWDGKAGVRLAKVIASLDLLNLDRH